MALSEIPQGFSADFNDRGQILLLTRTCSPLADGMRAVVS